MAQEEIKNSLQNQFFKEKSILPAYNFYCYIDPDLNDSIDIKPYHIKNINLPFYRFRGEQIKIGHLSYTLPVLEHDGFEFNVTFEEDRNGTIYELINNLQSKIVDRNGFFRSYDSRNIRQFYVIVTDQAGNQVFKVIFQNVFLMNVQDLTLDYDGSASVKYNCTFKADWFDVQMYNKKQINDGSPKMSPTSFEQIFGSP